MGKPSHFIKGKTNNSNEEFQRKCWLTVLKKKLPMCWNRKLGIVIYIQKLNVYDIVCAVMMSKFRINHPELPCNISLALPFFLSMWYEPWHYNLIAVAGVSYVCTISHSHYIFVTKWINVVPFSILIIIFSLWMGYRNFNAFCNLWIIGGWDTTVLWPCLIFCILTS